MNFKGSGNHFWNTSEGVHLILDLTQLIGYILGACVRYTGVIWDKTIFWFFINLWHHIFQSVERSEIG